jgi:hypothetical protein
MTAKNSLSCRKKPIFLVKCKTMQNGKLFRENLLRFFY